MKSIGLFALCLTTVSSQALSNDECVGAKVISHESLPFVAMVNTTLATNNPDDLLTTCTFSNDGNTFWYEYKPSLDGLMVVKTEAPLDNDKRFESVIGVFTGPCDSLAEAACKNVDFHETVWYPVAAGETYFIKVGAEYDYGVVPGILNFTLSFDPNYFAVVNADTDRPIGPLLDLYQGKFLFTEGTIDYGISTTTSLSIEAEFNSNATVTAVRSVRFTLDKPRRNVCESGPPFTLFGDAKGDIVGSPFVIGSRLVTATPYTRSNCRGTAGKRLSQNFTVVGCFYVNYALYDGRRDKYISSLYNASTVRNPPCQVNIGVEFVCGFTPGMVRLELRNATNNRIVSSRAETTAPYFLFGDNGQGNIHVGSIPAGDYTITAIIDGVVHPAVRFTIGACNPSPPAVDKTFNIDLRLDLDNLLTYENSKFFSTAVDRISSLVIGDRPDVMNTTSLPTDDLCGKYPPMIDDLFICARIVEFGPGSGTLGFIFSSYARESDGLPFAGTIILSKAYFNNSVATGDAGFFVQQQLIQVLGLGLSWEPLGLAESTTPCKYNGTKATAEFKAITGCASIPLEQLDESSSCLFWDQECLKEEILTLSVGKKKISRITLGALEDLGYVVNYTAADPYGASDIGKCAGCGRRINEQAAAPISSSSCHHGSSYENAIIQGRKMLRKVSQKYKNQDMTKLPEGIVYMGDQQISVAYMHEDGTICSTMVRPK